MMVTYDVYYWLLGCMYILGVMVGFFIIACIICGVCWLIKYFRCERRFYKDLRNLYVFEGEQGTGRNVSAEIIERLKESNDNVL